MGAGALFILVVLLAAIALVGGGVYAIALKLRAKKLGHAGDEVEAPQPEESPAMMAEGRTPPEHLEVESEQRARFVGTGRDATRRGSAGQARSLGTR